MAYSLWGIRAVLKKKSGDKKKEIGFFTYL
jgi:hypothetical protein